MKHKHSWLATVVFVLVTGGIALGPWVLSRGTDAADSAFRRKVETAERMTYYRVTAVQGPRFRLVGGETELRLITHLVLDGPVRYDPTRVYEYAVQISARSPGGAVVWQQTVHTLSRQSKDEWDGRIWHKENAFSLWTDTEFTDSRVLLVTLPRGLPAGTEIEPRLVRGDSPTAIVRAYKQIPRGAFDAWRYRLGLSPDAGRNLVDRLTFHTWPSLSTEQQDASVEHELVRVSAAGFEGRDFETQTVFVTGFERPSPRRELDPPDVMIPPGGGAAFNIWGTKTVGLTVRGDCSSPPFEVEVEANFADGGNRTMSLAPCSAHETGTLEAIGSVTTVAVRSPSDAETDIGVVVQTLDDERAVRPDRRKMAAYLAGPGHPPLELDLVESTRPLERAFRLDVRHLLSTGLDRGQRARPGDPERVSASGTVQISFEDEAHHQLGTATWSLAPPVPSEFEGVDGGGDQPPGRIALAEAIRLFSPPGAVAARIWCDVDATIGIAAYRPSESGVRWADPYRNAISSLVRWRYAPLAGRNWHPIRARNHLALGAAGSVASVLAQTRLEPMRRPEDLAAPGELPQTLVPQEVGVSRVVLEPGRPGPTSSALGYTVLRPNRNVSVRVEPGRPLVVRYGFDGDLQAVLGSEHTIFVDGEAHPQVAVATWGAWQIDGVLPGRHTVRVDTPAQKARFFANQLPARRRALTYRRRTLHEVTTSGLVFDVIRPEESITLNAVFYSCGPRSPPSRVAISLDGGKPLRRASVIVNRITRASREIELREVEADNALTIDDDVTRCRVTARVPVRIGKDVAGEKHTVRIRRVQGSPVWVRAFRLGGPEQRDPGSRWIERDESTEDIIDGL